MDEILVWEDPQRETLELVASGQTLTQIGAAHGAGGSLTEILSWSRNDPKFREALKEALKTRAMVMHEQAIDSARSAVKETAAAEKLRVDTLKWASAIGDPGTYGTKPKDAENDGPIIIVTGIVRDDQPEVIEAQPALEGGEAFDSEDNNDGVHSEAEPSDSAPTTETI